MRYMSLEIITLEGYKKKCFMLLHVPLSTSDKELQKAKKKKKKKKKNSSFKSFELSRRPRNNYIQNIEHFGKKAFFHASRSCKLTQ